MNADKDRQREKERDRDRDYEREAREARERERDRERRERDREREEEAKNRERKWLEKQMMREHEKELEAIKEQVCRHFVIDLKFLLSVLVSKQESSGPRSVKLYLSES